MTITAQAAVPMCAACQRRPVQKPGDTFTITNPSSARHGQTLPTKHAQYCQPCLDRCGDAEDTYHRCRVCQPHPEPVQPDTSIRDNECQCSIIERCALCRRSGSTTSAYDDGINPVCGDLLKSKCDYCGCCRTCVGCHCNED